MKTNIFILIFTIIFTITCCGQNEVYDSILTKAEQYVSVKDYKNASIEYSNAFRSLEWKAFPQDRYNAAKVWSLMGIKDSAFYNLERLIDKTDFLEYPLLILEKEFQALHTDERWEKILKTLNPNAEKYNDSLSNLLSMIYNTDQKYRSSIDSSKTHIAELKYQDSVNLAQIGQIIEKHGWLSINEVGKKGNTTLWLVLQHAPLKVMEKYLPVLQKAVEKGKASKKNLAYFQDRILMHQGKKQIYGTQYSSMNEINEIQLWQVDDPINLNKRRKSMGLSPINIDQK